MNVDLSAQPREPLEPQVGSSLVSQGRFFVEKGVYEVRTHIQNSPTVIRAGSFVGGLCVIVLAILNVLNVFRITYDCITYLVNMYQLLFGITTLFLEGKKTWFFVTRVQEAIFREAHFLSLINGRALFYIFEGSLFAIQMQFFSWLVGGYMVLLGLVMIYQGGKHGFVTPADGDTLMEPLDTPENAQPV